MSTHYQLDACVPTGMIYSRSPSVISQVHTAFLEPLEILDKQVLGVLQVPKASQVLKVSEGVMSNELGWGGGKESFIPMKF